MDANAALKPQTDTHTHTCISGFIAFVIWPNDRVSFSAVDSIWYKVVRLLHTPTAASDASADITAYQFIWPCYCSHCTVSNAPSVVSALWNSLIVFSHDNVFRVSSIVSDASLLVMWEQNLWLSYVNGMIKKTCNSHLPYWLTDFCGVVMTSCHRRPFQCTLQFDGSKNRISSTEILY
jgi:hypothetical protein